MSIWKMAILRFRYVFGVANGQRRTPKKPVQEITDLANLPGAELPSLYASRYSVAVGDAVTRISFGDAVGSRATFHTAITMTTAGAVQLANQILQTLAMHAEKKVAKEKEAKDA